MGKGVQVHKAKMYLSKISINNVQMMKINAVHTGIIRLLLPMTAILGHLGLMLIQGMMGSRKQVIHEVSGFDSAQEMIAYILLMFFQDKQDWQLRHFGILSNCPYCK